MEMEWNNGSQFILNSWVKGFFSKNKISWKGRNLKVCWNNFLIIWAKMKFTPKLFYFSISISFFSQILWTPFIFHLLLLFFYCPSTPWEKGWGRKLWEPPVSAFDQPSTAIPSGRRRSLQLSREWPVEQRKFLLSNLLVLSVWERERERAEVEKLMLV